MSGHGDRISMHKPLSDDDIRAIAAEFENRDFAPAELATIRHTRRRVPRRGDTAAIVDNQGRR